MSDYANKIFDGPDHISEVKKLPWKDVVSADFHVSVFANPDPNLQERLIFAPRYNTIEVLRDASNDASKHGEKMVKEGECDDFHIEIVVANVAWPHIILVPSHNKD
jgi:hypothetical protein